MNSADVNSDDHNDVLSAVELSAEATWGEKLLSGITPWKNPKRERK